MDEFVASLIGVDAETLRKVSQTLLLIYAIAMFFHRPEYRLPVLLVLLVANLLMHIWER